MPKTANVKISWVRSVSTDVNRRTISITKDGETTVAELGPEVSEYSIQLAALSAVLVRTTVFDTDGNETSSDELAFTIGDLEAPQPDTGLTWEITRITDSGDDGILPRLPMDLPRGMTMAPVPGTASVEERGMIRKLIRNLAKRELMRKGKSAAQAEKELAATDRMTFGEFLQWIMQNLPAILAAVMQILAL